MDDPDSNILEATGSNTPVDYLMPEGAGGQAAAGFSAAAQREKFLEGGSAPRESLKPKSEIGIRKSVEVHGQPWSYLEYGNPDGRPILNVHGWLGSSAEGQDHLSRAFAGEVQDSPGLQTLVRENSESARKLGERVLAMEGKYRVISPDLPGFGITAPIENASLDAMADQLADFQQAVGIEKSIAVGSSMGGILATKLAARHPEAVDAIVLQGTMTQPEDMAKVPYVGAQVATWGPIPDLLERFNLSNKLFASIVKGSKDFQIADTETQQRVIRDTLSSDQNTAARTLREIGHDIGEDIRNVECPVIVIDGANGDLVPIMKSHEVTKRFYPDTPVSEKVREKVVFLPIGGSAGEQGHNLVNTFPESIASWVD